MSLRRLTCGNGVFLLSKNTRENNHKGLLKILQDSMNNSMKIISLSKEYTYNAKPDSLACYIRNDCQYQYFIDNKLFCFNSKELKEHYND